VNSENVSTELYSNARHYWNVWCVLPFQRYAAVVFFRKQTSLREDVHVVRVGTGKKIWMFHKNSDEN